MSRMDRVLNDTGLYVCITGYSMYSLPHVLCTRNTDDLGRRTTALSVKIWPGYHPVH
jgi:hypothetical protein